MPPPHFSPAIDAILAAAPPMPLDGGAIDVTLGEKLRAHDLTLLFAPAAIREPAAARAGLAGLWLRANDLDASHRISQSLETPEGSCWHAIMHRREGDYGNAKYWLRRVGRHPALEGWDPFRFVDQVEACVVHGDGDRAGLVALQEREWVRLFEHCWNLAQKKS